MITNTQLIELLQDNVDGEYMKELYLLPENIKESVQIKKVTVIENAYNN
jgi:hypothetical protein